MATHWHIVMDPREQSTLHAVHCAESEQKLSHLASCACASLMAVVVMGNLAKTLLWFSEQYSPFFESLNVGMDVSWSNSKCRVTPDSSKWVSPRNWAL